MLGQNAIQRLLKHCEKIEEAWGNINPKSPQEEVDRSINIGWIQALRLVDEKDTFINDKPIGGFTELQNLLQQGTG